MAEGRKVDLREDGLLWLINRTVFHPRGYALAYDDETHTFMLLGDGAEPWSYIGTQITEYATLNEGVEPVDEDCLFDKVRELMP